MIGYLIQQQNRISSTITKDDSKFFNIVLCGKNRLFSYIRTLLKKINGSTKSTYFLLVPFLDFLFGYIILLFLKLVSKLCTNLSYNTDNVILYATLFH